MGVENNECVIATTWNADAFNSIRKWVDTLNPKYQTLFAFLPSLINHKQTIILGPDGSKKGWDLAKKGELLRDSFIKKIKEFDYEDGSSPFNFVEVGYGEFGQKILRGNNVNCYSNAEYEEAK